MTNCNACPLKYTLITCSATPAGACCALQLLHFLSTACPDPLKFLQETKPSLQALEK